MSRLVCFSQEPKYVPFTKETNETGFVTGTHATIVNIDSNFENPHTCHKLVTD